MDVVNSSPSACDAAGANGALPARTRLAGLLSGRDRRLFLDGAPALVAALPEAPAWVEPGVRSAFEARLRELNPEVVLTGWSTGALPRGWVESPECALRYVCHLAGSVRTLVPRTFLERGGLVTNWGEIPSLAVAEQGLLLALAALRNLGAWPTVIAHRHEIGHHVEWLRTRTLAGRAVGIHGFGRVARALVSLLRPFGGAIAAHSAGVPEALMRAAEVTPVASLPELFARSEILFECEALTPATEHSVNAAALAALPEGAVFVNIGRGGVVDEVALLREARSGRIRLALDVVASEPLTPDAEIGRVPGAVLSPHIGGPTYDQYPRCGEFALANLARFFRGEPLEAQVTLADYDRAT